MLVVYRFVTLKKKKWNSKLLTSYNIKEQAYVIQKRKVRAACFRILWIHFVLGIPIQWILWAQGDPRKKLFNE